MTPEHEYLYNQYKENSPNALRDLQYSYELRQKRLDKFGLILDGDFSPCGHFPEGYAVRVWNDGKYSSTVSCFSCRIDRYVTQGGRRLYRKKEDILGYVTTTAAAYPELVADDDYICPNCGAVSKIKQLLDGCAYCGSRYEMKQLYPKITNYYKVRDAGDTKPVLKAEIRRYILCGILVMIPVTFAISLSGTGEYSPIACILGGAVNGIIFGYIFWAFRKLSSLMKDAGRAIPMAVDIIGSADAFSGRMQKYSPEFSYEHFTGQIMAMLFVVVYSDDDAVLPFYKARAGHMFEDVIDCDFRGGLSLEKFSVEGDICTVQVKAFLSNLHYTGHKVIQKDETIRLTVKKDLRGGLKGRHTLNAIHCSGCGAGFDAYRTKICPYCGRAYELKDLDWVITDIK